MSQRSYKSILKFSIESECKNDWKVFLLNFSYFSHFAFCAWNLGFYRTNYDVENWGLLAEDFLQLPDTTQAQLMNDAFALARAELLNITVALNLTPKMQKNKNYVTWLAFLDNIKFIKSLIEDTESYEAFQVPSSICMHNAYSYTVKCIQHSQWSNTTIAAPM